MNTNYDNQISYDLRNEIMTLAEIAKYLKVSEKTVVRMVRSGRLPGSKVSSQWRFQRTIIDNWLTTRMQTASSDGLTNIIKTTQEPISIPEIITNDRILMNINPSSKDDILSQLVKPLDDHNIVSNLNNFLRDLRDRELMVSTAIGGGVAVPHVREQEDSGIRQTTMVLGLCKNGTDFDSLDGKKTHLFFLICAKSTVTHLKILAKIMLMIRQPNMVKRFCECNTCDEVMKLL